MDSQEVMPGRFNPLGISDKLEEARRRKVRGMNIFFLNFIHTHFCTHFSWFMLNIVNLNWEFYPFKHMSIHVCRDRSWKFWVGESCDGFVFHFTFGKNCFLLNHCAQVLFFLHPLLCRNISGHCPTLNYNNSLFLMLSFQWKKEYVIVYMYSAWLYH